MKTWCVITGAIAWHWRTDSTYSLGPKVSWKMNNWTFWPRADTVIWTTETEW